MDELGGQADYDDAGDEEDWFGEGSAFDSGEDLAAALFSLAGVGDSPTYSGADDTEEVYETDRPGRAATATISFGSDAFQTVDRPLAAPAPSTPSAPVAPNSWSVRPQVPGTGRTNWSMRHSMQFLRTTEEVIKRLRNEATELTWQASAVAVAQEPVPPRGSQRT